MPYISITGLRLNSVLNAPAFWWHAVRSMGQAQAAPGNISAGARTINGIHHTLTVWQSETAMRAYLTSGPHLAAMRAFHGMATGKTLGFTADIPPDWDRVHDLWLEQGRTV
jgi:hypothetical protein